MCVCVQTLTECITDKPPFENSRWKTASKKQTNWLYEFEKKTTIDVNWLLERDGRSTFFWSFLESSRSTCFDDLSAIHLFILCMLITTAFFCSLFSFFSIKISVPILFMVCQLWTETCYIGLCMKYNLVRSSLAPVAIIFGATNQMYMTCLEQRTLFLSSFLDLFSCFEIEMQPTAKYFRLWQSIKIL